MTEIAIIIPARYGSTRFPGKPLAQIAGKSLLARTCEIALTAAKHFNQIQIIVATDDERIAKHVEQLGLAWTMTSRDCPTGTDRVLSCVRELVNLPEFIINLQGDAALTPPEVLVKMIEAYLQNPVLPTLTPAVQLTWHQLDRLRQQKQTTPFSGTSVVLDPNWQALWFSKQIIPMIRDEAQKRKVDSLSPVFLHLGVYGYTYAMLQTFVNLKQTTHEILEGLEQLRLVENGYPIQVVPMTLDVIPTGIDTLEDAKRVERQILEGAVAL